MRESSKTNERETPLQPEISRRKQAQEESERTVSVLTATLDATADGILAIDMRGKILFVNRRFAEMWRIPEAILAEPTDTRVLECALERLEDPEGFLRWLQLIQMDPDTTGYQNLLRLKDGQIFEHSSSPQRISGHTAGLVITFRDVTQRHRAEATQHALYRASLLIQEPLQLQERLDRLLHTAQTVLDLDRINILLATADGQWLEAVASLGAQEPLATIRVPIGPAGGALAKAYHTMQPIAWGGSEPVPEPLRLQPPYDQIKAFRSQVFAIVPLMVQGRAIGVLGADRKHTRRSLDPATLEALQLFAGQAALAIDQARLYEAAEAEKMRWQALYRLGSLLSRSLNLKELYPAFAEAIKALLPYDRIGIVVPEGDRLVMVLSITQSPLPSHQGNVWPLMDNTAVGWVLRNGAPRIVRDLAIEQAFADEAHVAQEGVRATLIHPLLVGGEAVGAFFLDNRTPNIYTERSLELLGPVSEQLALALHNSQLYEALQRATIQLEGTVGILKSTVEEEKELARTDPLTGLMNARAFREMAEAEIIRTRRYHHPFSVAYMDIDDFKTVNDHFGHSIGDALLRLVAKTMKSNSRAVDVICRLGGDEFIILFPETGPEPALLACRKLHERLRDAVQHNDWSATFSIGAITFLQPPSAADEMITLADGLMYAAKKSGKNRIRHEVYPIQTTDCSRGSLERHE